ncbi:MAG TPA: ISKra4 family transposase [Terriglobales bacterium]|nr:ISKra4 family transposase [Terriglobales bacterium]
MSSMGTVVASPRRYVIGLEGWALQMEASLEQTIQCADDGMGHLEEQLSVGTLELQRQALERAAQAKVDATPPKCPVCGRALVRKERGHERSVQTRFGPVKLRRTRGWCRYCQQWRFPADAALRLDQTSTASPAVQEAAAMLVAQMPVADAAVILERLTGVKWSPSTLDREARRQGRRAEQQRDELNSALADWEQLVATAQAQAARGSASAQPFTLVIEIDAWNIRERDGWGRTAALRQAGQAPARWHWVYGATVFRLDQRGETDGGRPMISERGSVMTRRGVDGLRELLWGEAVRRRLLEAQQVLVVADGAVWIWKLVEDRFGWAEQLLDWYHASQHLWAVANALHGEGTKQARDWVEPLLARLRDGQPTKVIRRLEQLELTCQPSAAETVAREREYFQTHQGRMDYQKATVNGWPLGSGAMESSCRQYQCRFKRTGQFWSETGDEALLALHDSWRNGRWRQLFPHIGCADPSRN